MSSSVWAQFQEADSTQLKGQRIWLQTGILMSNQNEVPFWMKNNSGGRFSDKESNAIYQNVLYRGSIVEDASIRPFWEVELFSSASSQGAYGKIIQANAGLEIGDYLLSAGLDEEIFGLNDSTLSIGALYYGNNALPIPKIRFQTHGWVNSPILSSVFSFKAYLAHGWMEKSRFQSSALLHEKYLYGRAQFFNKKLSLIAGLHHNAFWSGRNLDKEQTQPGGFKNYARIFLGKSGGVDALQTDQNNALGNHLGAYELKGSYAFKGFTISNYWQFLWEDSSGLTPFNWRDGMVGISVELNKPSLIKKLVFEIVRTNDQDAEKRGKDGQPFLEPDNFFNNSVYRTGWTYNDLVLANPMFLLNPEANGTISRVSNMVNAWHLGIEGGYRHWNYRFRYIQFQNQGTKSIKYDEVRRLNALDVEISSQLNRNSSAYLRMNFQKGNIGESTFGLMAGYRWMISL